MSPIHVCRDCDTVYAGVTLGPFEVARCPCCRAVVARYPAVDIDKAIAIALACGIFLIVANVTPVLGIKVAGSQTEATLWQAVLSMGDGWIFFSALVLLVTMLLVPLVQIVLVLWVMGFARLSREAPGLSEVLALLHELRPWSMSEVFLLGALVAIVKLSNFLPVSAGPGVWALAALTALLAVLGHFDPASWWDLRTRQA